MIKIVAISDTHTKHEKITIPNCDILIHAGDESFRGLKSELENFALWLNKQPAKHIIWVPGNHSIDFSKKYPNSINWIKDHCPKANILIHESIEIDNIKIFGSPWTPYFNNWAYNAGRTDIESKIRNIPFIKDLWKNIPDDVDILITHGPPRMILDRTFSGSHEGCGELRNRISYLNRLKVHVFGHIHEAYGQQTLDGVHYINAAICNINYDPVNPITEIEYETT